MAVYLISYDVTEKDAFEYEGLWALLREIKATKVLYSEWLLVHSGTDCSRIYNLLSAKMQSKDRLLVSQLSANATWSSLLISNEAFRSIMASA